MGFQVGVQTILRARTGPYVNFRVAYMQRALSSSMSWSIFVPFSGVVSARLTLGLSTGDTGADSGLRSGDALGVRIGSGVGLRLLPRIGLRLRLRLRLRRLDISTD